MFMRREGLLASLLGTLLCLTVPAGAQDLGEYSVLPDKTHLLRYYYNCRGRVAPLVVKADRGFVRTEKSTRFICGNTDQPVVQITYLSPEGFRGTDIVRYYLGGRLDQIDRVNVGSKRTARLVQDAEPVELTSDQEQTLFRVYNCSDKITDPSVSAQNGFVTIRDGTTEACGRYNQPSRNVVYRSASRFVGQDRVVIKTDFAPPITIPITVSAGSAPSPRSQDVVSPAPSPAPAAVSESFDERPVPFLTSDQRWIVTASRQDFAEAKALARGLAASMNDVHVVRAQNGWFGVVSGPHERQPALDLL